MVRSLVCSLALGVVPLGALGADTNTCADEISLLQGSGLRDAIRHRHAEAASDHSVYDLGPENRQQKMVPSYLGCFVDDGARDLQDGPRQYGYTTASCSEACSSYSYFALQHNGWCVCGNAYSTAAQYSQVLDDQCGNPCAGEATGRCGAGWRNAVYSVNQEPELQEPELQELPQLVGDSAQMTDAVEDAGEPTNVWVELHNARRAQHGACPVVWNEAVAEGMQEWVDGLTSLQHSNSYQMAPPQGPAGENLAWGSPSISPDQTVQMWYDEVSDCTTLPGCEHGEGGAAVGHFTAMVWKGVKSIGCAISQNGQYAGCRYRSGDHLSADTANMGGSYVNNVGPTGESSSGC